MGSAKTIIKEQNRAAVAPSLPGIYSGITVISRKGPVGTPFLITQEDELIDIFGAPDPSLGTSMYSAIIYLTQGNKLWVTRAVHDDAKRASALVRSKVEPVPQGVPDSSFLVDPIISPIMSGLTESEFDSFSFPIYSTTREYEYSTLSVLAPVINSNQVKVLEFKNLKAGDDIVFHGLTADAATDPSLNETKYGILETQDTTITHNRVELDSAINVLEGTPVYKSGVDNMPESYPVTPTVTRTDENTSVILVDNADYLQPGDTLLIDGQTVVFNSKGLFHEDAKLLILDKPVPYAPTTTKIWEVTQSEFEQRDAFLVTALNPGAWGNSTSIAITPSNSYDDAVKIVVYYQGVQVETWEVTLTSKLDGFGNQLYIEDKINGNSAYIEIKDNPDDVDSDGNPQLPLLTNRSYWRQLPEDQFLPTGAVLNENLLLGHQEVQINTSGLTASLTLGSRLKFLLQDGSLSAEYKVLTISSGVITLDRQIIEEEIPRLYIDLETGMPTPTEVYYFDTDYVDLANGITNGVKYFPVDKLDTVLYNYPIGSSFTISGKTGVLLDSGANLMTGGSRGTLPTISDMINALNVLDNKEETPIYAMMDGGTTHPAYQQALKAVADKHNLTHVYASTSLGAEDALNYKQAIVDYKASTMINTDKVSFFSGWVRILDTYNQKYVWVSPESFALAAQCYTTRNYQMWEPAAGWLKGQVDGLDVRVKFSEGDRDWFVDNRINPIRHKKGSGLAIWGNETSLTQPGPLQLRSVSMLLIVIKNAMEGLLDFKHFDLNNERTWTQVESALTVFMRDEIKAKGGVYDFQVAVKSLITDTDLDNRRLPVFLGLKPTSDIKEIPATLAIFNNSVDIAI